MGGGGGKGEVGRSRHKTKTKTFRLTRTGQDRTGQDRTGQDRTGQDLTRTYIYIYLQRGPEAARVIAEHGGNVSPVVTQLAVREQKDIVFGSRPWRERDGRVQMVHPASAARG